MRSHPAGLDEVELIAASADAWDLDIQTLTYVPKGGGSYHWLAETPDGQPWFLTVDDLDRKPWLGGDRGSVFDGLQRAFDVALALQEETGCRFVVASIRTQAGTSLHRLSSQYSLAVFPFIDGHAGEWGQPLPPADRTQLLVALADLHRSTPSVERRAARRGLDLPGRADLEDALCQLGQPWPGGPFGEPACTALTDNADLVRQWLSTFDDLTAQVERSGPELVITHGEPHPANTIRVGDELFLIDWDTVGLAPPERDLWMFDDGSADGLDPYIKATGNDIDTTAIALYRLTWTLADLAAFVAVLRSPHQNTADTDKAFNAFTSYFR
jgi:spectinomycin phosphotransferase